MAGRPSQTRRRRSGTAQETSLVTSVMNHTAEDTASKFGYREQSPGAFNKKGNILAAAEQDRTGIGGKLYSQYALLRDSLPAKREEGLLRVAGARGQTQVEAVEGCSVSHEGTAHRAQIIKAGRLRDQEASKEQHRVPTS